VSAVHGPVPARGRANPEDSAIADWIAELGPEYVIRERAVLDAAQKATFETWAAIPVILRPADVEQLQAVLRVANRHRFPVYPISSGKNWGYGSRVPTAERCALLDLSRMNRIVDFNEELAYVTLQPGVTQRQLYEFLQQRGGRLWMDATGASPECSIIGNTMERGFGHTPYGDHFRFVCGLQVVLPNGEIVETGFSGFKGSQTGSIYRWGVGPSLDGLFSQSNLGIVTKMTVWLMPAPQCFQAFFFRCDDEGSLARIVDALRPLRLNGTLRSSIHIGNDYKVLCGLQQYPWEFTAGRAPLTTSEMAYFRKKGNFGYWNASGGLYGTRGQVREARKLVRKALAGKVNRLQFVDEAKLNLAARFSGIYRWFTGWDLGRAIELVKPLIGLMQGVPTTKPLDSLYWRKRFPVPSDPNPDRDGCGLIWCAPVIPLDGSHAQRVASLAIDIVSKYKFEPMLSLTLVDDRAISCVVSISYDREVIGDDQQARSCHSELLTAFLDAGYPPYRLGVQSMSRVRLPDSINRFTNDIRRVIDPAGILAPGRYHST